MKAVGIIVEYNPFHNGHLHHIQKAKELSNADIVIAVMSGPFLQRGEPALLSKWHRAEMALSGGVDLVIELPYAFSTQHATIFAQGAVQLLDSMGCDAICFGSESGDILKFINTYYLLTKNKDVFNTNIKKHLQAGSSYPKAMAATFTEMTSTEDVVDLTLPNNILGFEYVKAVLSLSLPIEIHTVQRLNAGYHDKFFTSDTIASATSIRKEIIEGNSLDTITPYINAATLKILQDYKQRFATFHEWEKYWPYLKFRLMQMTSTELQTIYEVEEGIENRILAVYEKASSFQEFISLLKTKRYTWTRLQRICVHILTNTKKEEMNANNTPAYLRLLGSSKQGRAYLKDRKKALKLPLISKLSSFQHNQIDLDIRAASIYTLAAQTSHQKTLLAMEYSQPPIMKN
ncbi:nucleotidyltransferase [Niallia circulans]|uniref:tRNA(Met) cytidine acetate ligase n=1 Tax=Niallia circulans TaxID=1397 RepID=A0A553SPB1_NIACI|nr:nucleotidyltransferase [Niallia circulans]TRZ38832.1 nucleotidyltransferase [Niallia circulans]